MLKVLKVIIIILVAALVIGAVTYFLGPSMPAPAFSNSLPEINPTLTTVDDFVAAKETSSDSIKADNEARIIWYDSTGQKTKYAVVYLHGFGASQGEGDPVHRHLANSLQANLYLPRLAGHGLQKKEAFVGFTAERYMQSAMEALSLGKILGDELILVGTSTGAAQAIYLAAKFPDKISALVLYSPFIELADENLQTLSTGPWSEQIAKAMLGKDVSYTERPDSVARYWSSYYHPDAYLSLFAMIQYSMTEEIFNQVEQPVFMAYYYKDEENQDDVVSVKAMQEMFSQLETDNKKAIAFPATGNHVIASKWRSNNWQAVEDSTLKFLTNTLSLKP